MTGLGYHEAQTFSFLGRDELDNLQLPMDDDRRSAIRVRNPLREEEAYLRTTLLANLLKAVQYNVSHGIDDVALFEVGRVFLNAPDPDDSRVPHQPVHLAFVATGGVGPTGLQGAESAADVFAAAGTIRALFSALGLTGEIRQTAVAGYHPGRSGEVLLDGEPVGVIGELHPGVARAFGLSERVIAAELELSALLEDRGLWQLDPPSTYPRVEFDLAFVVDESLPSASLVKAVKASAGEWLESVGVFDEFHGEALGKDNKSIAMRLVFRAPDHTLTNEEIAPQREAIITAVADATGGQLRGA